MIQYELRYCFDNLGLLLCIVLVISQIEYKMTFGGDEMAVLHQEYYKGTGKGQAKIQVNRDIRSYIEDNPSGDFSQVLAMDARWQVFYHLSDMRASILNWYEWSKNGSILEIGGEFGALTGLLCKHGKHVTTIEYGLFKAETICKRHSNRENLDVYAGNLFDMEFAEKFDYIVMIGSLERQCGGSNSLEDYHRYMKKIVTLLKPNGKLLAAVENRYGLRYFCGEVETYTGKPYAGINHYPQGARGYTFSKKELYDIMCSAGFKAVKFYYPLPDYKLPQMIYSDEFLPQKDLGERLLFYHLNKNTLVASENNLYEDLIDNHVFPFFANSYLTECSLDGKYSTTIFAAVTTDRGKYHAMSTSVFYSSGGEERRVRKRALYREGISNVRAVYDNMMELKKHGITIVPHYLENDDIIMPFIPKITCSDYLRKLVMLGDGDAFELIFELIYQNILKSSELVPAEENKFPEVGGNVVEYGPILKRCYVDMVPFNCFYVNGKLLYFDQEFVMEDYPALYPMYRALMYTYYFIPDAEKLVPIHEMKRRYGLIELWDVFQKEEDRFVSDNRRHEVYQNFYKWIGDDLTRINCNAELLLKSEFFHECDAD